jgi:nitroreductase
MPGMELFEAIRTLRSVREFTDKPVSEEALRMLLELAVCAPSGGNRQPWEFVVIRDPATRRAIRDYYAQAFQRYKQRVQEQAADGHPAAQAQVARWQKGPPDRYAENLHTIPVFILVCLDRQRLGLPRDDLSQPITAPTAYASIYPAVQNILLAAHGLGLGAVLTTLHLSYEREIKALLGIPDHIQTVALVTIGHPARKYGPPRRIPAAERTHDERWGKHTPSP